MRELGLILERKDELIDAISRLTEKAAIYQRKLDTQEKRRDFSKANQKYELQRSQFYRDLGGDVKAPINVEEEQVKSFWSTMWNPKECKENNYSDYLREYVPSFTSSVDY